jgi:hypothetical protein
MASERSAVAGSLIVTAIASLITVAMAWPVILHPNTAIFGNEIVGRHADPYATIFVIGNDAPRTAALQPLSDGLGWLLARALPPVAAFNFLILLSFPLAALTAYWLARYLTRSHGAALFAGLAFAFAPLHVAQAAYHPQIAQVQWWPLYVLGLIAMVERMSVPRAIGGLTAVAAVGLAALDAGVIAVLMAPVLLAVFWAIRDDADRNPWPFLKPAMAITALVAAGVALIVRYRPELFSSDAGMGYSLGDVAFFRGRWWAYVTPPIDNPFLAPIAERIVNVSDVTLQLTEMQIYVGFGLLLPALAALPIAIASWRREPRWRFVPAVIAAAITAVLLSLGPTSGDCPPTSLAPGCLLFGVAPMLRVYARFAIIAQLLIAVAAGLGIVLLAGRSRRGRTIAGACILLLAIEYWPLPARAHDVMPTTAHRWLAENPAAGQVLDCYPFSLAEGTIPWLTGRDIRFLGDDLPSCNDPKLGERLAAMGVHQMLVRRNRVASQPTHPLPPGLTLARAFDDADLYDVSQTPPAIAVTGTTGFLGLEQAGDDWWQWMGPTGAWDVRNTTSAPIEAALVVHLTPFAAPRTLTYSLDGGAEQRVAIPIDGREFTLGPWPLTPGAHQLRFAADGEALRPSDFSNTDDRRVLAVSFRNERWVLLPLPAK